MVVTEVLSGDVNRMETLDKEKKICFATIAHVAQLKSWWLINVDQKPKKEKLV